MPANPNSPKGFQMVQMHAGVVPNYSVRTGAIQGGASGLTNSVFSGDVLKAVSGGFFDVATEVSGGATIGGVAESFEWASISQGKLVRQLYWPGTPTDCVTGTNVTVRFYSGQDVVFEVQCLTGPITQANVGMYANFNVGAGGRTVGAGNYSSFTLDDGTLTTSTAMPFRIYQLPSGGGLYLPLTAQAGYDPNYAYNRVWVQLAAVSTPG